VGQERFKDTRIFVEGYLFALSGRNTLKSEIDDGNSVVHCALAHPSTSPVQRSNTNAMAAANALMPAQPEPFLFSPFFSFLPSLFFSPVGKYDEMIA